MEEGYVVEVLIFKVPFFQLNFAVRFKLKVSAAASNLCLFLSCVKAACFRQRTEWLSAKKRDHSRPLHLQLEWQKAAAISGRVKVS